MKLIVLYRPGSDHARSIDVFCHDFTKQTGKEVDLVSLDTVDGSRMAELYDITSYPAIIVRREDGELISAWQGEVLPLINEVAGYAL